MPRWNSANVLDATADARRVWQFDASKFALKAEQTKYPGEPLPAKMVGKDWTSLFQHKMNIALLSARDVFLRVIHLPKASLEETVSMVELQLEKISPVPMGQVVWTLHVLPHVTEGMQTVLVVIVGRNAVEEFLGKLEGQGYIADRLEVPFLEQLLATKIDGDGAWVYPEPGGAKNTAVVAWWYGGVLQSLDLVLMPGEGLTEEALRDQLRQMTWAGELTGWLTAPPAWHLVADEATASVWQPVVRSAVDTRVDVVAPVPAQEVASLTARRAVANPVKTHLLPPEYAARYRDQFIDRLWMRGVLAAAAIYVVGVLIYFAALQVLTFRTNRVENDLTGVSGVYTNAIELKARYAVLKDRSELKYAALDCWKAISDEMPDIMTLDAMNFNDGQKLVLSGTTEDPNEAINFGEALRKTTNSDQLLFDPGRSDPIPTFRGKSWTYNLELKRTEVLQ